MKVRVPAGTAALALGVMRAASAVADHWVQTTHQAAVKGAYDDAPLTFGMNDQGEAVAYGTASGRLACASHVASYVACQGLAVVATTRLTGVRLDSRALVAGLALSGVTHYWADRRRPLRELATRMGKLPFYQLNQGGMNGAYCLDQSFHHGIEAVAAVVMSVGATER